MVLEYGAIDGSSDVFNSPNFKPASIVSALNVLDVITKQPQNPTVVSYSKFNGPSYDDSDAATPLLLTIAKIFGNIFGFILKYNTQNSDKTIKLFVSDKIRIQKLSYSRLKPTIYFGSDSYIFF